jgi:hypothetical protein
MSKDNVRALSTIGILTVSTIILALPPSPPVEFWAYWLEFKDETGHLFDPVDLSKAEQLMREMKEGNTVEKKNSAKNEQPVQEDKP